LASCPKRGIFSMQYSKLCRRKMIASMIAYASVAWAASPGKADPSTPAAPQFGTPNDVSKSATTITQSSYAEFMQKLHATAQGYAKEHGKDLTDKDIKKLKDVGDSTIKSKGYTIPNPPMNLTVN
jgi:hypothetical protein